MKNLTYLLVAAALLLSNCTKKSSVQLPAETSPVQSANLKTLSGTPGDTYVPFDNNTVWQDTQNNNIQAQGGNIIKVGSVYHWFGMEYPQWVAVNHYTSTDLMNWTKQSAALTPGMSGLPFGATDWVGRPYVMWNPNTSLYVMAIEWNPPGVSGRNHYCFLTSSSVNGPWTYQSTKKIPSLPDAGGTQYSLGDLGVFVDGATAYLTYTFDKGGTNYAQGILKLDTDFMTPLSPTGDNYEEFSGGTWEPGVQEAADIIKRGSVYYYFTSLCNGWLSSQTRYRTASSVTSATSNWTANQVVATSPSSTNSFNTQHDFMIPVTGSSTTTYLYCGDRWNNMSASVGGTGQYQWFPMSFDASAIPVPTINGPNFSTDGGDWSLNLTTGNWSAGLSGYNFVQNASFENSLTDWTLTGNGSITTAAAEVHFGTKAFATYSTSAYTTTLKSAVSTAYPPGTYTAKIWSRGSGTFSQKQFQVIVNGTATSLTIPSTTTWTQYTITGITIPAGATVQAGVLLNASASAWTQFDDVEIVKN